MRLLSGPNREATIALALFNALALLVVALYFFGPGYIAPVLCAVILFTASINLYPGFIELMGRLKPMLIILRPVAAIVLVPLSLAITGLVSLFLGGAIYLLDFLSRVTSAGEARLSSGIGRLSRYRFHRPRFRWAQGTGLIALANILALVVIALTLLGIEFARYLALGSVGVMAFFLFCNFILPADPKE